MSSNTAERRCVMLMTLTVILVAVVSVALAKCTGDFTCQYNYFCYKPSDICIPCLDCSLYNRVVSKYQNCHRSPDDCGACLQGFREEYLAQNVKREACVVTDAAPTSTSTTPNLPKSTVTPAVRKVTVSSASDFPKELVMATATISVACVVVFTIIGFHIIKRRLRNNNSANSRQRPYEECPVETDFSVSDARTVVLHLPEQTVKERSLDAVPWRDAKYFNARCSSSESVSSTEEPGAEIIYLAVHDEDTNPSTWEPGFNQQPRNLQAAGSTSEQPEAAPEVSSLLLVPGNDCEQEQNTSQASTSSTLEAPEAVGTSAVSSQVDESRPFKHLAGTAGNDDDRGSDGDDDDDDDDGARQPARKRFHREDTLSLSNAPQVSPAALVGHASCSSLAQDLTAIPRFPSSVSSSNIRQP